MKKNLIVLLLVVAGLFANAQSGFVQGRYYTQQYSVQNLCGNVYSVFSGYYNNFGQAIYYGYQDCRRAEWHSQYDQWAGYFWEYNPVTGYYQWNYRTEWRTWWWYTWNNYTIRVY